MTLMDAERRTTCATRLWRVLAAIGVFGLAGPPVGGLVVWLSMGATTMRSPLPFITGSYAEGVALAAAAGTQVTAASWWLGKTSWLVPVVVALVVNVVMVAMSIAADPLRADLVASAVRVVSVFLPSSLVACVVCWWLTRRLLRFA